MPVVSGSTAAAAGAATGGTLFSYNRKNFMYDRQMRSGMEYQIMEMQIAKQDMFREDIKDIVELTEVKMDTYTIVTVFQMGFCIIAICEGRLAPGTPPWLVSAHTLSLCTAFSFFLVSVWLAMHAMVAAAAYKARLLTQVVRLPIPTWAQLEGARTYASQFEKTDARQMFRVPFLCGKQQNFARDGCFPAQQTSVPDPTSGATPSHSSASPRCQDSKASQQYKGMKSTDPWGLERPGTDVYEIDEDLQTDPRRLRHIQIIREAMQYWVAADGWSRVTMSIGTQVLATGLSYYVVGYVLMMHHAVVAAWLACLLFISMSWAVFRIDMSLTVGEYFAAWFLKSVPPLLILTCATLWVMDRGALAIQILAPTAYLVQTGWFLFLMRICKVVEQKNGVMLPTGYRAILYIDVFGWIKRPVGASAASQQDDAPEFEEPETLEANGPALQGTRYENGRPVPMRIEQLPGANKQPKPSDLSKSHFAPSTFVPSSFNIHGPDAYEPGTAGRRPYYVFRGVAIVFSCIWLISGVIVFLQVWNFTPLKLSPQLEQKVPLLVQLASNPLSLSNGERIPTKWPHGNVNAVGLACDAASNTIVAASRFGLYTANADKSTSIKFEAAPSCEDIEGEAIQDVSLECAGGSCKAILLHQHGRRMSACSLQTSRPAAMTNASQKARSQIAEQWLGSRGAPGSIRIQAFAQSNHCPGHDRDCTFLGTADQRIVEMQDAMNAQGSNALYPKRLLGTSTSTLASVPGGSMDTIGSRYLGILQKDGKHLQVLDLEKRGDIAGIWRLPAHPERKALIPQGKTWSAMCASGDHLYLLSKGLSPQIWRFQLPKQLH